MGLVLLTHCCYDPRIGRFVTSDPIGYKGGINLYGFVGNNPVNGSDPSGFAPPAKGPFGEPINPSDLYTHHPDTNHPNLHYDLKIPGNPLSTHPNETGLREYRFSLQTNQWAEKHKSRKRAAGRRFGAANLSVNAEERIIKGSMSKVNKAKFMKVLFAKWAQKIIKFIPDIDPEIDILNFLPVVSPDAILWAQQHPHSKPGDYEKYGKYHSQM